MAKLILWIIFCATMLLVLAGVGYSFWNRSGHTGLPLNLGYVVFGIVFAIGMTAKRLSKDRWLVARLNEVSGFLGIVWLLLVMNLDIFQRVSALDKARYARTLRFCRFGSGSFSFWWIFGMFVGFLDGLEA